MTVKNHTGLVGIEFVEFASPRPQELRALFEAFGFARTLRHEWRDVDAYRQGDIHLLLNCEPSSAASDFAKAHGPSISAMGWRFTSAEAAFAVAVARGATPALGDYVNGERLLAIEGIGGSLIYFFDDRSAPDARYAKLGFRSVTPAPAVPSTGLLAIDHLTNNVPRGHMERWARFYKEIFGFTEVRYFDIKGVKTGLTSYALRSPCGTFCIPINEGKEDRSQIDEYLREYKGPGVQHLAFTTDDIVRTLKALRAAGIETLDIDDQYYAEVFDRVPGVTEDRKTLKELQVLVDGDAEGYLLQIFTKNVVGPIFIEIIQRKNHQAFGEGNFGALFRSVEREQEKRGVL